MSSLTDRNDLASPSGASHSASAHIPDIFGSDSELSSLTSSKRTNPSDSRTNSEEAPAKKRARQDGEDVDEELLKLAGGERAVNLAGKGGEGEQEEGEEDEEPREKPIYDAQDDEYRCTSCLWTVHYGECDGCNETYEVDEEVKEHNDKVNYASESILPDENRKPPSYYGVEQDQPEELFDDVEFLVSLGATELMVERYKLVYSSLRGLFATADESLRTRFDVHPSQTVQYPAADGSGVVEVETPAQWRIHLGTSILLHPDDEDGTAFLVDLIDELVELQDDDFKSDSNICCWATVLEETEETVESDVWDEVAAEWRKEKKITIEWVTRRLGKDEELESDSDDEGSDDAPPPADNDNGDVFIDDAPQPEGASEEEDDDFDGIAMEEEAEAEDQEEQEEEQTGGVVEKMMEDDVEMGGGADFAGSKNEKPDAEDGGEKQDANDDNRVDGHNDDPTAAAASQPETSSHATAPLFSTSSPPRVRKVPKKVKKDSTTQDAQAAPASAEDVKGDVSGDEREHAVSSEL